MIIESFTIENWKCIRRVVVENLPPKGVIVLGGPNGTGKSSIIGALRSCLMDDKSDANTKELRQAKPKNCEDDPIISVVFRSGASTYRITKPYGSTKSKLESRTATGDWKLEASTAKEAHERTRELCGGCDSSKGLHQLLWLTQAEFQLPDAKKFDEGIKNRLGGILGRLQTPLDTRFVGAIKKRWSTWYSGERKSADKLKFKDGCDLAQNLHKLEAKTKELQVVEDRFASVQSWERELVGLEVRARDLERQQALCHGQCEILRQEWERSRERLRDREQAEQQHSAIVQIVESRRLNHELRSKALQRLSQEESAIEPAQQELDESQRRVTVAQEALKQLRDELQRRQTERRERQQSSEAVGAKMSVRALDEQLRFARADFERAEQLTHDIADLERELNCLAAPEPDVLTQLRDNRSRATALRADLEAAAISLHLIPADAADNSFVAVDGESASAISGPIRRAVRRKADLTLAAWGRIEIRRGTDARNVDQIEDDLHKLETEFAENIAGFGISPDDPQAIDKLLERASNQRLREPELAKLRKDLKKVAPKGIEPLRQRLSELANKVAASSSVGDPTPSLPDSAADLDRLARQLRDEIESTGKQIETLEANVAEAENSCANAQASDTNAKVSLAECRARANSARAELNRLPDERETAEALADAERQLDQIQELLDRTKLTESERTIKDRLEAAEAALKNVDRHQRVNDDRRLVLKTNVGREEGLHSARAALAAEVDLLTQKTERELLERDAVERLYASFEECKDQQLGALMTPIEKRVMNWMGRLGIGAYQEMRFNQSFLPQNLIARGGAIEMGIGEESTGTQEQIGMLVRLALGAMLSHPDDPAVAMFDDPLTHSDLMRLTGMQAVLHSAAAGDAAQKPPAGPLQIFVFTCHPEWFQGDQVIDLTNPTIMTRFAP